MLFILYFGLSFVLFGVIALTAIVISIFNNSINYETATILLYISLIASAGTSLLLGIFYKTLEK